MQSIVDLCAKVATVEMLREMAIFAQVVDSGSFSAAARQLALTTSAVSRHVSRLEAHMGGRLLHRTTRSLALTELGRQVHDGCARMLSTAREIHALAGSYSARPNGVIRVTAPVVLGQVWLAPRLPRFLALYPEVDLRLTLVDRLVDLVGEGYDLGIRIAHQLAPGLAARQLGDMRYILVAAPGYLAARGEPRQPQALAGHDCIHFGYLSHGDRWQLQRGGVRHSVAVTTRLTIDNSAAILGAVEAGAGIGLVTDFSAGAALAAGTVRQLLPEWQLCAPYAGAVHAVYMPGPHLALKVRVLIDYLVAEKF
ncbi:DNA-binding transcriptional LysR family regulator [Janthinobacterium sp. CG_23.3]|uniref:LysR family transcriptional regulator n=1 Tax=unclassified Janthinobacterium TaxID=2610881 RepID=UPI0003467959|nr:MULTISPECIES: LysR family transcriptional regulator [unclassified Janthinobacterium]MEC5163195.1 DNA-binding transcriptional LysR family regulator [Janthinobacterium sp. CG_S6]